MEELNDLLEKIKTQTESVTGISYRAQGTPPPITSMDSSRINLQPENKVSLSEYTPYSENTVMATLSDGSKVSKFKDFYPGTDNNERLAEEQTRVEKWGNGFAKLGLKTVNAVIGGTAGIIYGIGSAISDGNASSIYDNKFSNTLNDWDAKLGYQLPNYYTKQEENAGVFGQMGTANFWADKFLGGLAFTAGAIISEGIWGWATGGTSLATAGARLGGKIAGLGRAGRWGVEAIGEAGVVAGIAKNKSLFTRGLDFGTDALGLTDDALKARKFAIAGGKIGEVASIAGRTMRSAGYEASVEALQYKKEAEENFYRNFASVNGREPNADEINKFKVENESTANTVFGFNMGIVGLSNFVGLGHVLNIKNPVNLGITDFINKKAFGYGIDAATNAVTKGTTKQIIARNAFDYLIKPSFTEGLFEEGLQGVTNKTANKWIEHTYNPKYTNENFSQVDSFYDAMQEQYGTEKGWKDNILGMLIGVAGGSTNIKSAQNQKNSELEFEAKAQSTYNDKTLQSMLIPARIQSANREAGFTEAANQDEKNGNFASAQINKIGALTSFANTGFIIGETVADMSGKLKKSLDVMTSEQWAEAGVSQENIEKEKTEKIVEFEDIANAWKTNKQYVQYMVGSNMVGEKSLKGTELEGLFGSFSKNTQVVEALAWQLTVGEQSGKIVNQVKNKIGEELGQETAKVIETINQKNNLTPFLQKRVSILQQLASKSRIARDSITEEIVKIDSLEPNDANKKKRLTLTQRLLEAESKLTKAEQEAQEIANSIQASENYKNNLGDVSIVSNLITGADLLNLDENVKKFQSILEQQENLNPQRAQYLKDLLSEHNTARDMFIQAKTTQKALVSKEFKTENIDGWLSKLFKNGKEMNLNAKEWFEDSINKYTAFQTELINGIKAVSDAQEKEIELQAEIETGKISSETLQEIADKENLTKQEQQIYNSNKEAIDELRTLKNLETKPKSQEQIDTLKPQSENPIEQYKQRINKMFNELYDDLDMVNQEDLEAKRPTEQEINEYKDKPTEALKKKLQNWLLLDASTDDGYTSIVDLLDLISQHETDLEEITTKDEVNEEDVKDITAKSEGTGNADKKDVTNISTEPIVAKRVKDTGNIQLSHTKARYILSQIGKEYKQKRDGKYLETPNAEEMQVGDVIEVDGMSFSMVENYRLEFKEEDFNSRQQVLNLYIEESQNFYGNMSVYTVLGDERVKAPSQFQDDVLNREASFRIKVGDELTLTVNDKDGWNKTKKGGTQNEFKIYLKDKDGNYTQVLKSGETKFGSDFDEKFANLRLKAFENWEAQGRPDVMDLGITTTVKDVLLAAPELLFSDGQLVEGDINFDETQRVIISKGYVENEKLTLDNEVGEVSQVYVGRMTKNNPNLKIPIVVFKVGENTVAFPITMTKNSAPIEFDALLQGTPQEIVKKINQAIIDNNINTKKLVFSDVNITPSGEIEMSETAQKAKESFANNTTFVTADILAQKSYKAKSLVKDATIRIDLTNVEKVFSAPKVVIDIEGAVISQPKDVLNTSKMSIDDKAVDLLKDLKKTLNPDDFLRDEATDFFDDITDLTDGELDINNKNIGAIQKTGLKNQLDSVLDRFFTQEGKKMKSTLTTKEKNSMGESLNKLYDYIKARNILNKQMQTNQKEVEEGKNKICQLVK